MPEDQRVIGFAFDGTGYGTDGAIWGGEVLVAGYDGFERPVHLRNVPLAGGDATVRKPYRAALAHLWAAGIEWSPDLPPVRYASEYEREVVRSQLQHSVQCIPSSSMGRLFDAVSSLHGPAARGLLRGAGRNGARVGGERQPRRGTALCLRRRRR